MDDPSRIHIGLRVLNPELVSDGQAHQAEADVGKVLCCVSHDAPLVIPEFRLHTRDAAVSGADATFSDIAIVGKHPSRRAVHQGTSIGDSNICICGNDYRPRDRCLREHVSDESVGRGTPGRRSIIVSLLSPVVPHPFTGADESNTPIPSSFCIVDFGLNYSEKRDHAYRYERRGFHSVLHHIPLVVPEFRLHTRPATVLNADAITRWSEVDPAAHRICPNITSSSHKRSASPHRNLCEGNRRIQVRSSIPGVRAPDPDFSRVSQHSADARIHSKDTACWVDVSFGPTAHQHLSRRHQTHQPKADKRKSFSTILHSDLPVRLNNDSTKSRAVRATGPNGHYIR